MGKGIKNNDKNKDKPSPEVPVQPLPAEQYSGDPYQASFNDPEEVRRMALGDGTAQGRWDNISQTEQQQIALWIAEKEAAKKLVAGRVVAPFIEGLAEPFIEDAAAYLGKKIPAAIVEAVSEAIVDGGVGVLEGEGLATILASTGFAVAGLLPIIGPAIIIGVTAYEIAKELNEESERRERLERREYNGGLDLRKDDTYISKNKPTKGRLGTEWVQADKSVGGMVMIGGQYKFLDPLNGYAVQEGEVVPLWQQVDKPYTGLLPLSDFAQHWYMVQQDISAQEKKKKEEHTRYVKNRPAVLEAHAKSTTDAFDPAKLDMGIFDPANTTPFVIAPSTDRLVNTDPASNNRPSYSFSKPKVEDRALYEEMLQAGYEDLNNPETHMLNPNYHGRYGLYNPHPKWVHAAQPDYMGWTANLQPSQNTTAKPAVKGSVKKIAHPQMHAAKTTPQASAPATNVNDIPGLNFSSGFNASQAQPSTSSSSGGYTPSSFNMPNHSLPLGQLNMSAPAGGSGAMWPGLGAPAPKHHHAKKHTHHHSSSTHGLLPKHNIAGKKHATYNITVKEVVGQKVNTQHLNGTHTDSKISGEQIAKILKSVVSASQLHTHD